MHICIGHGSYNIRLVSIGVGAAADIEFDLLEEVSIGLGWRVLG
jgi:hypothetical protein